MNQSNDPNSFQTTYFPEESQDYVFEVPAQAKYIHKSRNPSGFTPMETVQLEGQAYRQVSSGRSPWWVLFTLFFLLGIPLFLFAIPLFLALIPLLGVGSLGLLPYLIGGLVVSLILGRGIWAKLHAK